MALGLCEGLACGTGCRSKKRRAPAPVDEPVVAPDPRPGVPEISKTAKIIAAPAGTPDYGSDALTRAEGLLREGKGRDAILLLLGAAATNPKDVRTQVLLGEAYRQDKRGADAIAAYDRALALEPNDPTALVGACIARGERGDARPAVLVCEKAVKLRRDDVDLQFSLGLSYMQDQKAQFALPLLEQVLVSDKLVKVLSSQSLVSQKLSTTSVLT